jgi:alpha-tubulin suppressor-like RCC1 family protein
MRLRILCLLLVFPGATAACDSLFNPGGDYPHGLWIRQTGVVLAPGDSVTLTALGMETDNSLVLPPEDARWWTEDAAVLRLDGAGNAEALAPGRATVWVEVGSARDSGTVVVTDETHAHQARWKSVEVGGGTTCALTVADRAHCWGEDYWGQIGDGVRRQWTLTHTPVEVSGGHVFEEIDVGGDFACARTAAGDGYCWGIGLVLTTKLGREGDHVLAPTRVSFPEAFAQLRAGLMHICGLVASGEAYCWGSNYRGALGDGTAGIANNRYSPTPVDTDLRFQEIVPGDWRTCALTSEGASYCWGSDAYIRPPPEQRIGDSTVPIPISGGHRFQMLAGSFHHCGLALEGTTHCWGNNAHLQLGNRSVAYGFEPVPLSTDPGFESISASDFSTCGILPGGAAHCWGDDSYRNLGTGEPAPEACGDRSHIPCSSEPLPVTGDLRFAQISMSTGTTCGVTTDGALYCWGSNEFGQLGDGSLVEQSPVPVRVADPL